jgi:hypothetical protein
MKRREFIKSSLFSLAAGSLSVSAIGKTNISDSSAAVGFYVSPDGKDSNPGRENTPFATLTRARDAVRGRIRVGITKDIVVLVRGGTYSLIEAVAFGPEDSGTEKFSVTYVAVPGEKVVLEGGRQITGWTKGAGELWTTEIPEVRTGNWYFRQLFVNGRRAPRARMPKADDEKPWWKIETSTVRGGTYEDRKNRPPENEPVVITVSGPVADYRNPEDVELVYVVNNDGGRKRLQSVDAQARTLTLALPNRWNPVQFDSDCYLSIPSAGKACYLENALEFLNRPGEWYLDRKTGILSYWPRTGEDMSRAAVIAPVVQKSLIAVVGTSTKPVENLHFRGLRIEHVEWPLPPEGYMGLFCCNVAVFREPNPGHRFIDAAVEFDQARNCSFRDGGIGHVGAMGLCLREGTTDIAVEGNEIHDLGGGGIGAGGCNVAAGYLNAAPPPQPGEFLHYNISNNYVHHCGTDYYGAAGIILALAQEAVIAHNLIHDTAYFGIGVAGSQDPKVPFAGSHRIEFNHIHDAMQVTVDGAALYITFAHYGRGILVHGNLIHDTEHGLGNETWGLHPPCAGIYLDGNCSGGHFEENVLYRNLAAGPLIFDNFPAQQSNTFVDNLFQKDGTPPQPFLDAVQALAGLEHAYRLALLGDDSAMCRYAALSDPAGGKGCAVYQFDLPRQGRGVIEIIRRTDADEVVPIALRGLDTASRYDLKGYSGTLNQDKVWGTGSTMPMLSNVASVPLPKVGLTIADGSTSIAGRTLNEGGLVLKPENSAQVLWIAYRRI